WHVSYGFRPGRSTHGAIEHVRMAIRPRAKAADGKRRTMPYHWAIEGDIKGCFDQLSHHAVMQRLRQRVADRKVTRLILQFLKAGVMTEEQFIRTPAGTPQGGIISPLLANIALSAIEERYERWVYQRRPRRTASGMKAAQYARLSDRTAGRNVLFPIRYADDFVILVYGTQEDAQTEKEALAEYLHKELGLELSPEKTKVTALTEGFAFLGFRVRLRWDPRFGYTPRIEIPKAKQLDVRYRVKQMTKRNRALEPLERKLQELNPTLRGWVYYYRYCTNAKDVFSRLDWYTRDRIWRWLRKKYPKANATQILRRRQPSTAVPTHKVWRDGRHEQFIATRVPVTRYRRGWMGTPAYAKAPGEPDA
ncbi:reverse transcriptase domain-containing protein, partial [Myxococcota bacterium]